jgi:tRNA threonylcarbamoyladenosine biosynthesis protein TsaE
MQKVYTIEEIENIADVFLEKILEKRLENLAKLNFPAKATLICLTGELGAGKTTLMQIVGKKLGIENKMPSPTFVLRRDYLTSPNLSLAGEGQNIKNLIHIDAYRLDKPEMLGQILTKSEMGNSDNLIVIEWGERLDQNIFDLIFEIKHLGENQREIILQK